MTQRPIKQAVPFGRSRATVWSVGASFLAKPVSTPLSFTATTMDSATLGSLDAILPPGELILSGWNLSADSGYTPGDPAYLSLAIGAGHSEESLQKWQYTGSAWTPFSANDLTCDGNYASFTVTGLGDYAVTGSLVPEPSTRVLLAAGAVGIADHIGRRRKAGKRSATRG